MGTRTSAVEQSFILAYQPAAKLLGFICNTECTNKVKAPVFEAESK